MAENKIPIRTALMPLYYKDFHCIMGACQDNCCDDGWRIEFNKKDYLTIKRAPKSAELEAEMKEGMRRLREQEHDNMYAEFQVTEGGRCAFHTPEGLCRLQMECGAETLPKVCRVFPRRVSYSYAAQESSLSPACEGVLALLWDLPEGIDFWEEPLPEKDWRTLTPPDGVIARFACIRSLCIDVLQERSMKLSQRLLMLGVLFQQLQELDWNDGDALDKWLVQGEMLIHDPAAAEQLDQLPGSLQMFISNNLRLLTSLLSDSRGQLAQELLDAITDHNGKTGNNVTFQLPTYQALEKKLDELLGHSEYFFENLMVTVAFHTVFPNLNSPEDLWKAYVSLCSLYSNYRFAAVCAMDKEASRERLFHAIVHISRAMIHNSGRQIKLRDEFFQNDSATLAHMAILVGG